MPRFFASILCSRELWATEVHTVLRCCYVGYSYSTSAVKGLSIISTYIIVKSVASSHCCLLRNMVKVVHFLYCPKRMKKWFPPVNFFKNWENSKNERFYHQLTMVVSFTKLNLKQLPMQGANEGSRGPRLMASKLI